MEAGAAVRTGKPQMEQAYPELLARAPAPATSLSQLRRADLLVTGLSVKGQHSLATGYFFEV